MKKLIIILAFLFTGLTSIKAQLGINTTGATPHPSAMLDVSSTTKGILAPRMTTAQRIAIIQPATGLLVYDTNLNEFYGFSNAIWKAVGGNNAIIAPLDLTSGGTTIIGRSTQQYSNDNGVMGEITNNDGGGTGVYGVSTKVLPSADNYGIYGWNKSENSKGFGVYGQHSGSGVAVKGITTDGVGVWAESSNGVGLKGISGASNGVDGQSQTQSGVAGGSISNNGVFGISNTGNGGYFTSNSGLALATGTGNINLSGFTKLGSDATTPKIKMKKLTGTTPTSANPNTWTTIPIGLIDVSKILSVSVLISTNVFQYLPHSTEVGFLYTANVDGTDLLIGVKTVTQSTNVMGKPIKVLITYEE